VRSAALLLLHRHSLSLISLRCSLLDTGVHVRRPGSGVLFQLDFLFVRKDSIMMKNAAEYVFGWVSPGG
jgi:hypothetical protein